MDRLPEGTETERLVLRRLTPEDEPALSTAVIANVEHLRPWMPWAAHEPISPGRRRELIATWEQEWRDGGDLHCGVFLDDAYIGNIGLHRRGTADSLEIGYWIHVNHTRRGYITEASVAMTTLATNQPGIERVNIHHDRANLASGAVPTRLGYTLQREVSREIDAPGQEGVECQWQTTRPQWRARPVDVPD